MMSRLVAAIALLSILAGFCFAGTNTKTFGKEPTLTEPTAISALSKEPGKYADQTVLLTGKIVGMCMESGCWVRLLSPDSSTVICKSLDESIHFSKNCLGQQARIQGKVMYDKKAPDKDEMKSENGGPAHACPAPKLLVSLEGGIVEFAEAPAATDPVATPAAEKKAEGDKTVEPQKKVDSK